MVETGFWCWVPGAGCRVPVLVVPGAGAGAGAVSWLCTWWKQVAGAGCRVPLVETGCWCWVPGAGAGAGAVSWLCTWWRQVLVLVLGAGLLAPCGIYPLQVLFWPTAVSRAVLFAHILSVFQHATHTIVVLDIAWPSSASNLSRKHARATHCYLKLLQHRPQIAKACKRYFWAAPCIGSSSNSYTQYSVACLHYAHSQRQRPAPAPNLHHTHTQRAPATRQRIPAPSTGASSQHHTRAASARHPVSTTRAAS